MKNAIVRFLKEDSGTEMVEWALIAGLIVVVGAAIFSTIGGNVDTIFTNLSGEVAAAASSS